MPTGGMIGAGPFHSQSNESWFFGVPGLKIVYPSNPYDAKGLLNSSIDDENPVLYFEHKALYRSISDEIPQDLYNIEIGKGKIVCNGDSLTIVTYGIGVQWIKKYLDDNKNLKGKIELIDLRSLLPWDKDLVLSSVSKTNRVLILNEDNLTGSVSGEIGSYIAEHGFDLLDAPISRLGALDTPIPFSSNLEKNIYMPINKIDKAVRKLLNY